MTVEGTEQRVYGTLVGTTSLISCKIDLNRFAVVYGSVDNSPIEAPDDTYYGGNNLIYKQCGHEHNGFITIFLKNMTVIIEVRVCKKNPNTILIETYGELPATQVDLSVWFNKGVDTHYETFNDFPKMGFSKITYINDSTGKAYIWKNDSYQEGSYWFKLNSTTAGNRLPGNPKVDTFEFEESKNHGTTIITCCRKCPPCKCKECDITDRFVVTSRPDLIMTTYDYPQDPEKGLHSVVFSSGSLPVIIINYTLKCNEISINIYTPNPLAEDVEVTYRDDDGILQKIGSGDEFDNTITFPFDYIKNCWPDIILPITDYCATRIKVEGITSKRFLKMVHDCGGSGIAYLKLNDSYHELLTIRAVTPILKYDINGWIDIDLDRWMTTDPWPNQTPLSNNIIHFAQYTKLDYHINNGGLLGGLMSDTICFAELHDPHLKVTIAVWAEISIKPEGENPNHQILQINKPRIKYAGGTGHVVDGSRALNGIYNSEKTVYTCPEQTFTFTFRNNTSSNYVNTYNDKLFKQYVTINMYTMPAYNAGHKTSEISWGMRLISIDDVCGDTNFYPSKGLTFKSFPFYTRGIGEDPPFTLEFNDRQVLYNYDRY